MNLEANPFSDLEADLFIDLASVEADPFIDLAPFISCLISLSLDLTLNLFQHLISSTVLKHSSSDYLKQES